MQEHTFLGQLRLVQCDRRVQILDITLGEEVGFLGEGRANDLRRARHNGAAGHVLNAFNKAGNMGQCREENTVQRLARVMLEHQVMNVRLYHLGRVTGVDRAVLATGLPQLFRGIVREHNIASRHAQRFKIGAPEWPGAPHIQYFGHPDAEFLSQCLRRFV